jgi:hypothetical protein
VVVVPLGYDALTQSQGHYLTESGLQDSLAAVMRDSASWAGLWRSIVGVESSDSAALLPPRVDFARDMVLVYSLGRSMTMGAWRLEVESSRLQGDTLVVLVRKRIPGARCFPANDGIDSPVAVATTARRTGVVRFEVQDQIEACP